MAEFLYAGKTIIEELRNAKSNKIILRYLRTTPFFVQ